MISQLQTVSAGTDAQHPGRAHGQCDRSNPPALGPPVRPGRARLLPGPGSHFVPMASRLATLMFAALSVSATSVAAFVSTTNFKSNNILTSVSDVDVCRQLQRMPFAKRSIGCRTAKLLNMAEVSIDSLVEKIRATSPQTKRPDKLFKSIKKASGAPTVSVEFSRTPGSPRQNVESISLAFRRSKAAVICVDTQYPYEGGEQVRCQQSCSAKLLQPSRPPDN